MTKELGPYREIKERKDSLYALLVSAGYLKVASPLEDGRCRVAIPNHEIAQVFVKAREQIDGKKYDTTFRAEGIADIEKIGLAYCKDKVELCR